MWVAIDAPLDLLQLCVANLCRDACLPIAGQLENGLGLAFSYDARTSNQVPMTLLIQARVSEG